MTEIPSVKEFIYSYICQKITKKLKYSNSFRPLLLLTIMMFSILMQSCATILGGSRDASYVKNGTPLNADVYYNGTFVGQAPAKIKVPKSAKQGNSVVEIQADGYETAKIDMTRKVSFGYLLLDVLTGVIWLGFDFATGNIYKPRPNKIEYNLKAKEGYNPAENYDYKIGDEVLFSKGEYENHQGTIVAIYPNRALIKFKRAATRKELKKQGLELVEDQIEVAFVNIAKV